MGRNLEGIQLEDYISKSYIEGVGRLTFLEKKSVFVALRNKIRSSLKHIPEDEQEDLRETYTYILTQFMNALANKGEGLVDVWNEMITLKDKLDLLLKRKPSN